MNREKSGMIKESIAGYNSRTALAGYLQLDKNEEQLLIQACRNNDISFLGLFGSYSRGEQKRNSDVDLLTRFSRRKSLLDHVRIERELSEIIGVKVDLVTEKSLSSYLVDKVMNEAIRYEMGL